MNIFEENTNSFDGPDFGSEENFAVVLVKGILGAIVGAVPGFLLWLLIAKLGYVSSLCGVVIAMGSAYGFAFMTKKNSVSPILAIVVCLIVMTAAVFLAIRIDWAWEIAKFFEESIYIEFEASMAEFGVTSAESRELYNEYMTEEFGFNEPNFSNCLAKLDMLIEYFELKSDYIGELIKGFCFSIFGGGVYFAKTMKQ